MKNTFAYKPSTGSGELAPYVDLLISNPLGSKTIECTAMIDTGYDGEIVVPIKLYDDLNLAAFEYSENLFAKAETITGEKLVLRTASGSVTIRGIDVSIATTIDSHRTLTEPLIGRKFLETFDVILKGKDKKTEITFIE